MQPMLDIQTSDRTGLPYAMVPTEVMWDLVEFLSYQRVAVSYEYRATHFTVCFQKTDAKTAQYLLDTWAESAHHLQVASR